MSKQLVTQMSVTQYDELVAKFLDGSLKKKWAEIEEQGKPKTKKDEVEERQLRVIAMIFGSDNEVNKTFAKGVKQKNWEMMKVYKDENGHITGELLGKVKRP